MKESNYGESTEAFLWITQSNGRNKFEIANFLMRETKKKHRGELITFRFPPDTLLP